MAGAGCLGGQYSTSGDGQDDRGDVSCSSVGEAVSVTARQLAEAIQTGGGGLFAGGGGLLGDLGLLVEPIGAASCSPVWAVAHDDQDPPRRTVNPGVLVARRLPAGDAREGVRGLNAPVTFYDRDGRRG